MSVRRVSECVFFSFFILFFSIVLGCCQKMFVLAGWGKTEVEGERIDEPLPISYILIILTNPQSVSIIMLSVVEYYPTRVMTSFPETMKRASVLGS